MTTWKVWVSRDTRESACVEVEADSHGEAEDKAVAHAKLAETLGSGVPSLDYERDECALSDPFANGAFKKGESDE